LVLGLDATRGGGFVRAFVVFVGSSRLVAKPE